MDGISLYVFTIIYTDFMPDRNHIEKNHIFCGGHLSKPVLKLKAGNLSMIYEEGNIRYISSGKNEILRMIYSAVRDKKWLTISPEISDEKIEIQPDSFRIIYRCLYKSEDINFSAWYRIEGKSDNSLNFSFEGEALNTFEKCRIGFCILHPVEACSGKPCNIIHSDGHEETLSFPVYISPDQPFLDIISMKWKVDESDYSLVFSGDVFETEDQRNWTDASFKTYCTPLSIPCPATIRKGEKINQRIEFKSELGSIVETGEINEVKIVINPDQTYALPLIGIGRSTRHTPLTDKELNVLRTLDFDHYRTDLFLYNSNWRDDAEMAVREAAGLDYSLELALFFDNNYISQSEGFVNWVNERQPKISFISLFHKTESVTPEMLMDTVASMLKKTIPDVIIGSGTNANFAQLNRTFPFYDLSDYICYSIHPQEHASDNSTMIENLRAQSDSVKSAMHYSEGKDIRISPVTIQRRFNANIENYETSSSDNSFPTQIDSRLMSLFGAGWTTGSLKYLCESGVKGVTFYETVGERGIIQGDYSSQWPDKFQSDAGMIFPAAFVFKFLLEDKSLRVIISSSSHPLKFDSIVLSDGKKTKIIAANFTSEQQHISIEGITGYAGMRQLSAENYLVATSDLKWTESSPLTKISLNEMLLMEPFSISFINTDRNDNNI